LKILEAHEIDDSKTPSAIICLTRLEAGNARLTDGSVWLECDQCGIEISLSPVSQETLNKNPASKKFCLTCARTKINEQKRDEDEEPEFGLMPGQAKEITATILKNLSDGAK